MQRIAIFFAVVLAVTVMAGVALGHGPQGNYAQGVSGAPGTFWTGGYNHRHYNQVWHYEGRLWSVFYHTPNVGYHGVASGTSNPTRWGGETGYSIAFCRNFDDDSGVMWTCQTTGADVG